MSLGERLWDFDACEVLFFRCRIVDNDGKIERQARNIGEGVGWVDSEGREHRENTLLEILGERSLLLVVQVIPVPEVYSFTVEGGNELIVTGFDLPAGQLSRLRSNTVEDLARRQPRCRYRRDTGCDTAFEARHAHHVKLVKIR